MRGCAGFLRHPLLADFDHGFGTRRASEPHCARPRQVHGSEVAVVSREGAPVGDADAVVAGAPGIAVGIVTADCVPILVGHPSGRAVAIHAGWRGLACGVIPSALSQLAATGGSPADAVAVIGPHICVSHYEIDAPVRDALAPRYGNDLATALRATRPGHWQLDLAALARIDLRRAGLAAKRITKLEGVCTFAGPEFFSRRRDGPSADRLLHFIAAREVPGTLRTPGLDTGRRPT